MITVTISARHIPSGTTVRKPTGEKLYMLTRLLKIYGEDRREITPPEDVAYLVCEGNITGIQESVRLSIDFTNAPDAQDFCEELAYQEETPT